MAQRATAVSSAHLAVGARLPRAVQPLLLLPPHLLKRIPPAPTLGDQRRALAQLRCTVLVLGGMQSYIPASVHLTRAIPARIHLTRATPLRPTRVRLERGGHHILGDAVAPADTCTARADRDGRVHVASRVVDEDQRAHLVSRRTSEI